MKELTKLQNKHLKTAFRHKGNVVNFNYSTTPLVHKARCSYCGTHLVVAK